MNSFNHVLRKEKESLNDYIRCRDNDLQDIDAVLYLLDGKSVVSISCFFNNIKLLVNTWEYYVGMDVIRRLMNEWNNEYGDVNVLKLLEELRLLRKLVKDELVLLRSFR